MALNKKNITRVLIIALSLLASDASRGYAEPLSCHSEVFVKKTSSGSSGKIERWIDSLLKVLERLWYNFLAKYPTGEIDDVSPVDDESAETNAPSQEEQDQSDDVSFEVPDQPQ